MTVKEVEKTFDVYAPKDLLPIICDITGKKRSEEAEALNQYLKAMLTHWIEPKKALEDLITLAQKRV